MTALERAQAEKRKQDIKVENLPEAKRKCFRRIYRLEPHTSLSWEKSSLIKDIFGNLTVDAILFIYNAGYDAGRKAKKGGAYYGKDGSRELPQGIDGARAKGLHTGDGR